MATLFARTRHYFTGYVGDQTTRENIINNIWDGAWYSVMMGLTNSFLGVYALALGASDSMLGWLSSLPALVALLSQVPAAVITERQPRRLRVSVPFGLVFRSGYLLFAFIPFLPLPPIYRAWVFILLLSIINFPGTVSGVAWTAMMGDVFPSGLRGRIFSDRNMLLGLVQVVFTLIAGPLLDFLPYPVNFVLIFILSFAALMRSTWYQCKIKERTIDVEEITSEIRQEGSKLAGTKAALQDKPFLYFMLALFVIHLGFNVSSAMWTILYVRVLNISKTFIGALAVIGQLVSVASYRWWGRFADRHGHRFVLFLAVIGFAPQPWLYTFVHVPWPLVPLAMLSGFMGAGFNLILFSALLDIAPNEKVRPSYIALFNTAMGITGFAAPMLGILLYQSYSMKVVFTLATLLRFAGAGLMAWKVGVRSQPRVATE